MTHDAYVVTWWQGVTKRTQATVSRAAAEQLQREVRATSQALLRESYEPIRLMPKAVFDRMQALLADPSLRPKRKTCRHGCDYRLCIPCITLDVGGERTT